MEFATKIFLDGGDPEETKKADELLKKHGHVGIEGQTTNPSLILKRALEKLSFHGSHRESLGQEEALSFYRQTVEEIADITSGPISIQVVGTEETSSEILLRQARDYKVWIPQAVVKFPCTHQGIKAASEFCTEGPINMTLAFSQEQAASVYVATNNATNNVYISPFVGRLDDIGKNGMDVVANILQMYKRSGDGHVQVIAASIRSVEHILYSLRLKCNIISIPFTVLTAWCAMGFPTPPDDYTYDSHTLRPIPYTNTLLTRKWMEYAYDNELTQAGVKKFYEDWQKIIGEK